MTREVDKSHGNVRATAGEQSKDGFDFVSEARGRGSEQRRTLESNGIRSCLRGAIFDLGAIVAAYAHYHWSRAQKIAILTLNLELPKTQAMWRAAELGGAT